MKRSLIFLVMSVSFISQVLAHDHNGHSFSVAEAAQESQAAYIVMGMTAIIAFTSVYFIYSILRDEWRSSE